MNNLKQHISEEMELKIKRDILLCIKENYNANYLNLNHGQEDRLLSYSEEIYDMWLSDLEKKSNPIVKEIFEKGENLTLKIGDLSDTGNIVIPEDMNETSRKAFSSLTRVFTNRELYTNRCSGDKEYEGIKINNGQKIMKFLNNNGKVAEYMAYDLVLNASKTSGGVYVSINPLEVLTASSSSSWSSCYALDGEYAGSIMTHLLNGSMVAFVSTGHSFDGDFYKKNFRTIIPNNTASVALMPTYPKKFVGFEETVKQYVSKTFEKLIPIKVDDSRKPADVLENFADIEVYVEGFYCDYVDGCREVIFALSETRHNSESTTTIYIQDYNMTDYRYLVSPGLIGVIICSECDEYVCGEGYEMENGKHLCDYCYENHLVNCLSCGKETIRDTQYANMCPECRSNEDNSNMCVHCGDRNWDNPIVNFYGEQLTFCKKCLKDEVLINTVAPFEYRSKLSSLLTKMVGLDQNNRRIMVSTGDRSANSIFLRVDFIREVKPALVQKARRAILEYTKKTQNFSIEEIEFEYWDFKKGGRVCL